MKRKKLFFSIIVPFKNPGPYVEECLQACSRLNYKGFEVILSPDQPMPMPKLARQGKLKVRILPSGPVGPSYKRDLAAKVAKGDILAYLDDDAFPSPEWLDEASRVFQDPDVVGAGGPAVTPSQDSDARKASGWVYASALASGSYVYRYLPRPARDVDDYPTCNFLVRAAAMKKVGGFDTVYWPGEDTFVCLKLTRDLGKRLRYDPKILVYHHRRDLPAGHVRQVKAYALHRGFFAKRFPETSLRAHYFIPSLFLLFILAGPFACLLPPLLAMGYAAILLFYLFLVAATTASLPEKRFFVPVALGVMLTHVVYGAYFLAGLVASRMPEEPVLKS